MHGHTNIKFYIRGSVNRNSRLKTSNEMHQHAEMYLLLNYFTCRVIYKQINKSK